MYARRFLSGLAASAVTASVLALTATPAMAAQDADDTNTDANPGAVTDLVGTGSDTTQGVVRALANAYNAQSPAPASKVVSWAATSGGTITLPNGGGGAATTINRPANSGAGKTLLYGTGNNTNVDFARSSSSVSSSAAETAAGLQQFPFAVDTLIMTKSGQVASNAPASLTIQQILSIYKGDVTNWNQVGGNAGAIKPLIPADGSGTRSFFVAQLTAANGGVAPTFASTVTPVQEHDPAPIQGDANAIAPFSLAKRTTLATPANVTIEPGFSADRAVYNVVRGADVSNAAVLAAFGSSGFFCSSAGKTIIEAQGFKQLLPPSQGGVCGQPTQNATTNLATAQTATQTSVAVSSPGANQARIIATVTPSSASGTVTFFEGTTAVASNVPLQSGRADRTITATPGAHTYRAVFTPAANTAFTGSEGTGSGTVSATTAPPAKASSTLAASFPKKAVQGKKVKGSVTVKVSSGTATGTITVKLGSKTVGSGSISGGVAKITLKGLKVGKNKLTATYAGSATVNGSSDSFTVKVVKKAKKK